MRESGEAPAAAPSAASDLAEPAAVRTDEDQARWLLEFAADVYSTAGDDADPDDPEEFNELAEAGVRDAKLYVAEAQVHATLAVVDLLREVLRRLPPPSGAGS